MEVHIKQRELDITIKENGKSDIKMDANIEVFKYLNKYQNIFLNVLDDVNKKNSDYFNNAVAYLSWYAKSFNIRYLYNGIELPIPNDLKNASIENLPTSNEIKKYASKLNQIVLTSPTTIYEIEDISDVPLVCILHFSKYGYILKKCKNCNKWFIPRTTKDTKFCYRNDEVYKSMQCNIAYKYKLQQGKAKNDEIFILKKQVYNSLRNKALRTKDIQRKKDAEIKFDNFKKENIKKFDLFNQNKITKDDYINWLNSQK